ncbi:hypothetical protein BCR34DRAFT_559235 [Clohesyomyces aquaticus]|uniref:Secreted protein n=1 Tax=Clohesyomyces aquaticus TaxID=1231657 RepID=A0A1Y1ZY43_9PLEO|nr:hypothetical protein BCR34DRAFT_559235 [Clohesyomyces aquaticus]
MTVWTCGTGCHRCSSMLCFVFVASCTTSTNQLRPSEFSTDVACQARSGPALRLRSFARIAVEESSAYQPTILLLDY